MYRTASLPWSNTLKYRSKDFFLRFLRIWSLESATVSSFSLSKKLPHLANKYLNNWPQPPTRCGQYLIMLDVITLHAGVLLLFIIQSENVYCEDYNRVGSSDSCSTPYFSKLFHSQCQCQLNKIKHWLFLTDINFWVKYFRGAVFVNIFASVLQSDYQKKKNLLT